jgi:hypothetical protein
MLQIYHVYEKKGGEESPVFLRKKKGGTGLSSSGPFSSTVTRHPLHFDMTVTGGGATGLGPPLPLVGP